MPKRNRAVFILAAISSLMLVLTLLVGGREAAFVLHATKAAATFDGAVAHTGGNHGGTFLCPQFKFVTSDGQALEITSTFCSTGQPYSDGQPDFVLYDPQKPQQAVVAHFWFLWGGTVAAAVVTLTLIGVTWLIAYSRAHAS